MYCAAPVPCPLPPCCPPVSESWSRPCARGILSEFEDPTVASYSQVKQALLRRFGPTQIVEVHEQTLAQLRLQKGQSIRELAQEVQRLVKQAYPDILGPPRERLAVKHLINAVHDKDTVFYIREKNPKDITEACEFYERYNALTGEEISSRRNNVKGLTITVQTLKLTPK